MTERIEPGPAQSLSPGEARIAVIAGSGRLPEEVASKLAEQGRAPFIVALEGEGADGRFSAYDHILMPLEEGPRLLSILRQHAIGRIVLAGGVSRRPNPWKLRKNLHLLAMLARFLIPLARGDDNLLRAVARYFEDNGIKVTGAHEIVPDLLAREGPMTKTKPLAADMKDIDAGYEAARAIGALDVGQAAIAVGGRAVALEDIGGTDALLGRTRELREHGRLAGRKRGVLVKCAKPGQELRADLPTIGPATIEGAHAAGLAGVAVEAERSFVLDRAQTVRRADELGMFVFGIGRSER
ncbi:MAG: UDP-2,3-diacylglucosamine diphosphatase LpxI [Hyphomicrobiales bacterium]|nr:UDP-2,3-diacylglucosamine diphosphatase LpxI [Hyphomicrobiales bacterium]